MTTLFDYLSCNSFPQEKAPAYSEGQDYVNDTTPDIEKSAMASVHRDTRAVNDEIRRLKIERGQLSEDAAIVTFETKATKAKFLREIRVGDRLRCTDNKAVLGVFNGERVEIQEITRMRSGDTRTCSEA